MTLRNHFVSKYSSALAIGAAIICGTPLASAQSLTVTPSSSVYGPENTFVRFDISINNPYWNSTYTPEFASQLRFYANGDFIGGFNGVSFQYNLGEQTAYMSCDYKVRSEDISAGQIDFRVEFNWERYLFDQVSRWNPSLEMIADQNVTLLPANSIGAPTLSGTPCDSPVTRVSVTDSGPDQYVVPGTVVLDASGSSQSDGEPLDYEWRSINNKFPSPYVQESQNVSPTITMGTYPEPYDMRFYLFTRPQGQEHVPYTKGRILEIFVDPGETPERKCNPEFDAMMPTTTSAGEGFVFFIPIGDVCEEVFWIDPPVAVGYTYEATGTQFTHVKMPSTTTVPDPDGYELIYGSESVWLKPGGTFEFPSPVAGFEVRGINPELETDPENELAFPIGIDVAPPTSDVTINQKPITEEYPPVSVNNPPIADAGSDIRGVKPKQVVTIDGSISSDPDGDSLEYRWAQLSGLPVTLNDPASPAPTFKVPPGKVEEPWVFELTVSDGSETSKSTVTVYHQGRKGSRH